MELIKLVMKNFKGLSDFIIEPRGETVELFGDNGTGKTTIADAFFWLLFGKDSLNSAQFEIKPLGADGKPKTNIDVSVEGVFQFDGKQITLKKVYYEKYTKKRGSASKEFTGHTTDYFIDGVPTKKKEFDDTVKTIAEEQTFRLLTNPRYFNEVMTWQKRRALLLEICGNITDADVIDANEDLADLAGVLNGRNIDDHKKIIKARKTKINEELKALPIRIDEANNSFVKARGEKTVKSALAGINERLKEKNAELINLENGGGIASREKELAEIDAKRIRIESEISRENRKAKDDHDDAVEECRRAVDALDRVLEGEKGKLNRIEKEIAALEKQIADKRDEFFKVDAETFDTDEIVTICPTCGQDIPENQIEEARKNARAAFNQQQADRKRNINNAGKAVSSELKASRLDREKALAGIESTEKALAKAKANLKKAEEEPIKQAEFPPAHKEMADRTITLQTEIDGIKDGNSVAVESLKAEIGEIESQKAKLDTEILQIEENSKIDERIKKYMADEKRLAAEYERLECELNLCEDFIRAKVSMLETSINEKFDLARFKLFDEQINGGLAECCEVTVDGVPYGSLNNAMRINVGLSICEVVAAHHGRDFPIFVDNAEAVTDLYQTSAQQIRLFVSPDHPELVFGAETKKAA